MLKHNEKQDQNRGTRLKGIAIWKYREVDIQPLAYRVSKVF